MDSYDFHLQNEEPDSSFIYASVKREAVYWSEWNDAAEESPWRDRTKSSSPWLPRGEISTRAIMRVSDRVRNIHLPTSLAKSPPGVTMLISASWEPGSLSGFGCTCKIIKPVETTGIQPLVSLEFFSGFFSGFLVVFTIHRHISYIFLCVERA